MNKKSSPAAAVGAVAPSTPAMQGEEVPHKLDALFVVTAPENVPVVPEIAPVAATEDGVIAPATMVNAGVAPPEDEPEKPLAVAIETPVTVPVPAELKAHAVPVQFRKPGAREGSELLNKPTTSCDVDEPLKSPPGVKPPPPPELGLNAHPSYVTVTCGVVPPLSAVTFMRT